MPRYSVRLTPLQCNHSSDTRWVRMRLTSEPKLTSQPTGYLAESTTTDQVRFDELKHVEFLVNGRRCTIYTAFYGTTPVIVKVMRKDVQDKEIVRQVRVRLCASVFAYLTPQQNGPGGCLVLYGFRYSCYFVLVARLSFLIPSLEP